MIKIVHSFNTPAEAMAHLQQFGGNTAPAHAAPAYNPPPPAAPAHYAPPGAPQYPTPPQTVLPPAGPTPPAGSYAPPQGAPAQPPAHQPPAGQVATQAQVAAAAQNYAKVYGPKAAKAKFAELGVTKISEIQPANYGYALQALTVVAAA